ncbi:MAG: osmotically-inducible lipoprotein B [Symbiopectobacterium sp.]
MTLSGCSNMSKHDRNITIGARSGAVSGAILTGGGTLGGAAIGGIIDWSIGIISRLMAKPPCCQILY